MNPVTTAEKIIQSVCEIQEMPDLDHPETLVISVTDLRTIIENKLSELPQTRFLEAAIDSIQRENDRYTAALEKIMGGSMEADNWFRREARRALSGSYKTSKTNSQS